MRVNFALISVEFRTSSQKIMVLQNLCDDVLSYEEIREDIDTGEE